MARSHLGALAARCWLALLPITPGLAADKPAPAPNWIPPPPPSLAQRFRPDQVGQLALSPDGRHLAHVAREGHRLDLVITDVEHPESRVAFVIGEDDTGGVLSAQNAIIWATVKFLQWMAPDRIVYSVELPTDRGRTIEEIWSADALGKNRRKLLDGYALGDATIRPFRVLGSRFSDPGALAIQALGDPVVASALYRLDTATGKYTAIHTDTELGRYLYDQQGRSRLLEPPSSFVRAAVTERQESGGKTIAPPALIFQPQVYRVRPNADESRWRELEDYLRTEPSLAFSATLENFFLPHSLPIGFDTDPNVLYFASNVGRDTFALYALDLRTKKRTDFALEDPHLDVIDPSEPLNESILLFDRQRRFVGVRLPGPHARVRWVDPALAVLQGELDRKFPNRDVALLDWDDARQRFVVQVGAPDDPGRIYIYEPSPKRLREFFRRSPAYTRENLNRTTDFAFDTPEGVHLTGLFTQPRRAHLTPPPLILLCRDIPGRRDQPRVNPDTQALADLGFAVAEVNYRGSAGLGAMHRDAARAAIDRVPVEDLRTAVRWLATHRGINARRVALVGQDVGGYLALHAAQLYPNEFRCVIAINAPLDLAQWRRTAQATPFAPYELRTRGTFFDEATLARVKAEPLTATLSRPAMLVQDEFKPDLASDNGSTLEQRLTARGIPAEYLSLPINFARGDPDTRAKAYLRIAAFLNQYVYDFTVDVGTPAEVK